MNNSALEDKEMNKEKNRIAFLSDRETCLIFKNIGIDPLEAQNPGEASILLREKAKEYGIIFITEDLARDMTDVLHEFESESLPSIIEIPPFSGSMGLGREKMRRTFLRAVGADIQSKEE